MNSPSLLEVKVEKKCQVVAIDGLRGTGKSWLAKALRENFGCKALDIGPVFRVLAWLVEQKLAPDILSACDLLELAVETEWIRIHLDIGGTMSASRIVVRGNEVESDLWDQKLNTLIREAAGSDDVVKWVGEFAHHLVGTQPAVVVGREVGMKIFPEAPLKIFLQAGDEKRLERKISQLANHILDVPCEFSLEHSEPHSDWESKMEGVIKIDTTHLSRGEVLKVASDCIRCRLGWNDIPNASAIYAA